MDLIKIYEQANKQILSEAIQRDKIIDAIKNRDIVTIYYNGDKTINKGYRDIIPLVYGRIEGKNSNEGIRAWQLRGSSDSANEPHNDPLKNIPGYRLFRTSEIASWTRTGRKFDGDEEWTKRELPKYNPDDKQMSQIFYAFEPTKDKIINTDNEKPTKGRFATFGNFLKNKFKGFFK